MLKSLDQQIDRLSDKAQAILDTVLKQDKAGENIEHLIDTDRKLYQYLVAKNTVNDNARRLLVDEVIKTFRTLLYTLTKIIHRIEIVDERTDRIFQLEENIKSSKFKTYALVIIFLVFCLWSMASIQTSAAHMVFQFISSLFHSSWLGMLLPK